MKHRKWRKRKSDKNLFFYRMWRSFSGKSDETNDENRNGCVVDEMFSLWFLSFIIVARVEFFYFLFPVAIWCFSIVKKKTNSVFSQSTEEYYPTDWSLKNIQIRFGQLLEKSRPNASILSLNEIEFFVLLFLMNIIDWTEAKGMSRRHMHWISKLMCATWDEMNIRNKRVI